MRNKSKIYTRFFIALVALTFLTYLLENVKLHMWLALYFCWTTLICLGLGLSWKELAPLSTAARSNFLGQATGHEAGLRQLENMLL
jgi:hypothetical protein